MPINPHLSGIAKGLARRHPLLLNLSYRYRGIRGVAGVAALDPLLDEAMAGNAEVTQDVLKRLARIYLVPPRELALPPDPFSAEYAARQRWLYSQVASKDYDIANEAAPFDFERDKDNFFPYNTGSGEFVGGQLLSHGFLIRNMRLKPGAHVVEFGAGWGNSTQHLAMMGYEMTAVEVNKPSIALMNYRAGLHGRNIRTAEQDMVEFARTTDQRFDAALFVACFHHCHEHAELLGHLGRILSDDGVIYFADEPILPARAPSVPYPWGLRLDGISLYYTRRWGWLELGFQEGYFRAALERAGWEASIVPSTIEGVGDLYVARRRRRPGRG